MRTHPLSRKQPQSLWFTIVVSVMRLDEYSWIDVYTIPPRCRGKDRTGEVELDVLWVSVSHMVGILKVEVARPPVHVRFGSDWFGAGRTEGDIGDGDVSGISRAVPQSISPSVVV